MWCGSITEMDKVEGMCCPGAGMLPWLRAGGTTRAACQLQRWVCPGGKVSRFCDLSLRINAVLFLGGVCQQVLLLLYIMVVVSSMCRCKGTFAALPWLLQDRAVVSCSSGTEIRWVA